MLAQPGSLSLCLESPISQNLYRSLYPKLQVRLSEPESMASTMTRLVTSNCEFVQELLMFAQSLQPKGVRRDHARCCHGWHPNSLQARTHTIQPGEGG